MKEEFKKNSDKNATGNQKIKLKDWEQKLMLLLETDKTQSLQRYQMPIVQGSTSKDNTTTTSRIFSQLQSALEAKFIRALSSPNFA